jgi:hypothetical protein
VPSPRIQWTRADTIIVFALVAAGTLSWVPRMRGPIDFRWDAAVYYLLGTSIAGDLSYRLSNEPGEIGTTTFPPLLPLVVAAHQWLLGTDDPVVVGGWLRVTFWALLTAYLIAAFVLLRTRLPVGPAAVGVLLIALGWFPHWLSDRCYSDLPFALLAAGFFVFSTPAARHGRAAGACAIAAYLLRSAGIALLAAWVAERVSAGRWRSAAARLIISSVPVLAWQGYVFSVEHSDAYARPAYPYQRAAYNLYNVSYAKLATWRDHRHPQLGVATPAERVTRIFRNAALLPIAFGGTVSARRESWEGVMERIKATEGLRRAVPWAAIPAAMGTLGALVLLGLMRQARQGDVAVPVAVVVYSGTICIMPTSYMYELPRYLAVIAPVFALGLMSGVQLVRPALPRRLAAAVSALLFGFVVILQVVVLAELYISDSRDVEYSDWRGHRVRYRAFTYDDRSLGQDAAIAWLNRHANRDAIVVSSSPHWIHLRTGLRSVMPPMEADAARVAELLGAVPATYVLVEEGSFTGEYVAPVIRQRPGEWQRVLRDDEHDFELYERRVH